MPKDGELEFRYGLAKAIKYTRLENEWTQAELAERCKVTQACVAQWENGARLPSLYEYMNFMQATSNELDDILDLALVYAPNE